MSPLSVFISYAREDEAALNKLIKHLSSLQKEGLITGWYDRMTTAGGDWEHEIKARLDVADIVLLLVSADFTGSEYCVGVEAALAVERWRANKARVVPVIVRSVDWRKLPLGSGASQTSLGLLNALPRDGRPISLWPDEDEAYENVTSGLRAVIEDVRRHRDATPPPPAQDVRDEAPVRRAPQFAAPAPAAGARDAVQTAIDRLLPFIESDSVTWFLGSGAGSFADGASLRACDVSRRLLASLNLVDPQWRHVLPPVDVAASYFAAKNGVTALSQNVTTWMAEGAAAPGAYARLVALLAIARLRAREADAKALRPVRRNQPLIVTTNIDVLLECAFIAAGVPFTRIVQVHADPRDPRLEVAEYRGIGVENGGVVLRESDSPQARIVARVNPGDAASMYDVLGAVPGRPVTLEGAAAGQTNNQNPLESLSIKEFCPPIIYKLRGSIDVPESCAIASEQYFDFCLNVASRFVPTQIGTIVQHTPAVFLGFGYLDPDFSLVYYTFQRALTELRKEDRRLYSVRMPPAPETDDNYRLMELPIWEDLKDSGPRKAKIVTVESTVDTFLDRFTTSIDPQRTWYAQVAAGLSISSGNRG